MILKNNKIDPGIIRKHFEVIHDDYKDIYPKFNNFLEQHLFFITASFDMQRVIDFRSKAPTQLTEFRRLHFKISKFVLGSNLNRKRRLQPLTYAFMDFEGSRQGQSDPIHSELPHIHSLTLVVPAHIEKFRSAIFEPRLRSWIGSIESIEIENYSEQKGTVENLISYCKKGHEQASPFYSEREDLWAILPA